MAGDAMMPVTEEPLACQQPDALLIYDAATNPKDTQAINEARALCRGCPVRVSCYRHGRDTGSVGVFGGIYFPVKAMVSKGICRRGHDITGDNGRRRSSGSIACRVCEHNAWMAR